MQLQPSLHPQPLCPLLSTYYNSISVVSLLYFYNNYCVDQAFPWSIPIIFMILPFFVGILSFSMDYVITLD